MPAHNWRHIFPTYPLTSYDVKALLRAALSEKEWETVAISESEKGYGFTAPAPTMHRIYRLLDLAPPQGVPVAPESPPKDESPTVVGFEPPRATLGTPVHARKLRRVVVAPLTPSPSSAP